MKLEAIKLYNNNFISFHNGLRRLDRCSDIIHSDTLYSAIFNCFVKLFDEDKVNLLEDLIVSSVFWGIRGISKDILFIPMPSIPLKFLNEDKIDSKKYKKLQWLSFNAFKKLISCFDKQSQKIILEDINSFAFLNSITLVTKEEFDEFGEEVKFFGSILEPKVSISRQNLETNLYFQENFILCPIKLSSNKEIVPFLYFLKTNQNSLNEYFFPTINLLLEEGLGGERTTGKGLFDYYEKEDLEIPDNGNYEITLSLTFPSELEVNNLIYYQIVKRDGFIYYQKPTGFRKKTHYKIKEGALVKHPYVGMNINVSPVSEFKVISYGKSLGYKF